VRGTNDPAKVQEGLLIDLIAMEQVGIVAKVSKKPMQLPQSSLGAIQPAEERPVLGRLRLQNDKSELHEWFVRMFPIPSLLNANQKHAIEATFGILVLRVQAGNLMSHAFTSTGSA
jgi:hypothetical protein